MIAILAVILAALVSVQAQINYCDPTLCPPGRWHVGCNNTGAFFPGCQGTIVDIMPHIPLILETQNNVRNLTAGGMAPLPSAVRMGTLAWDPELARVALLNAVRCVPVNDECRNTPTYRFSGQNLVFFTSRNNDIPLFIREAVGGWAAERGNVNASDIQRYDLGFRDGRPIRQFLTMVSERNNRVGCAITRYTARFELEGTQLVCNYAVRPVRNNPIYRSGAVGSACTSGRNPTFGNLCAAAEAYEYNMWTT